MSIYNRIINDFAFLRDYGYTDIFECKHYEYPGVLFSNIMKKLTVAIGMDYRTDKMRVVISPKVTNLTSSRGFWSFDLMAGVLFHKRTYKTQVPYAQKVLKEWLDNNK